MDQIEEKKEVTLPMKRAKSSKAQAEEEPVLKKKQISSDSESEFDDAYLDDLENRLEKKLGPCSSFDDVLFMNSPYDSIFAAEVLSDDRFKDLENAFQNLEDGEELVQFLKIQKF